MPIVGFEWNQEENITNHLKVPLNKSFILFDGEYKKWNMRKERVISAVGLIPTLTSNTSASPNIIVSASTENNSSKGAWCSFDGAANGWNSAQVVPVSGWLNVKFNVSKKIGRYSIISDSNIRYHPRSWTFEGSNNGTDWIILDTQTNITWNNFEKKIFEINNSDFYINYRINIKEINGAAIIIIGNMQLFEVLSEESPYPSHWQTVSTTMPSEDTFMSEGMKNLSSLDRKQTMLYVDMADDEVLGEGKVFRGKVNLRKYKEINSIRVKD
ncbi:hypothetical protein EBB07_29640 [Paenibacillaceae bacterium]|nr:hypothetical protein EBB07_29640 [Paenibacillaceae bacterium]